ncbi:MAG: hypothetical protein QOE41_3719 [Mycobacterium sp.]|nr:hypothetical protein [Mycobacterium sp.]MDT5134408.1 hypothetical protein [Mycobacterium sp.]
MGWLKDRWHDLTDVSSGSWLAIAVWAAVALGVIALLYASRQLKRNRELKIEQIRPHVAMFMEPHAADWHVVELVVRNYGQSAAHDVEFSFLNPPTVAQYENAHDGMVDIAELRLPGELPVLAPGQEWRTVWDSALDRHELGGSIEWRFVGTATYHDRPDQKTRWRKFGAGRRRSYKTNVVLDWDDLQPVQRVELMTTHDLAKREKQKLELLRSLLGYFHYASQENRAEVYRSEIDRINRATEEARDRLRVKQLEAPTDVHLPRLQVAPKPDPDLQPDSDDEGRHHEQPV